MFNVQICFFIKIEIFIYLLFINLFIKISIQLIIIQCIFNFFSDVSSVIFETNLTDTDFEHLLNNKTPDSVILGGMTFQIFNYYSYIGVFLCTLLLC